MRLIDLDPRWFCLEEGGPRVGLTFNCPHCLVTRLGIAFHHLGHEAIDDNYIKVHPCGQNRFIWLLQGSEDFNLLTLTPSVDASAQGHWHGFITNGGIC